MFYKWWIVHIYVSFPQDIVKKHQKTGTSLDPDNLKYLSHFDLTTLSTWVNFSQDKSTSH